MFELIVFDLDGTLVDSRRDIAESANGVLESCGLAPLAEEQIGGMVGDGAATLVARVFAARGTPPPPDALDRFLSIYDGRLLNHTRPYPRMAEVLDALGRRSPLAVLTNKPFGAARSILKGLDLARYFDETAVIGGDGPFPRKPDPAGLQHLMAQRGAQPQATLMVGDSVIDWRTARRGQTAVCLVRYGFGFGGVPLEALTPADRVIDAPDGLLELQGIL